MRLVVTLAFIAAVTFTHASHNDDSIFKAMGNTCDTMFCSMGKECVMENKKPVCACIERCVGPVNPVCGNIGSKLHTYKSECHLYKDACIREDVKITLVSDKPCEEVKKDEKKVSVETEKSNEKMKPVVCTAKHRDGVRKAIIKWISSKLNFHMDAVSYKGTLLKYFFSLDLDNDKLVDTFEFMKLLEKDASITEILNHNNPVLRGLCSTELIAITDKNSDYKLGFEEFYKCLDPHFEPPQEKCELGGVVYDDGEDVPLTCDNACKCACGHWVCTQKKCEQHMMREHSNSARDQFET